MLHYTFPVMTKQLLSESEFSSKRDSFTRVTSYHDVNYSLFDWSKKSQREALQLDWLALRRYVTCTLRVVCVHPSPTKPQHLTVIPTTTTTQEWWTTQHVSSCT